MCLRGASPTLPPHPPDAQPCATAQDQTSREQAEGQQPNPSPMFLLLPILLPLPQCEAACTPQLLATQCPACIWQERQRPR